MSVSHPTTSSVPANVEHLDPNTVDIGENVRDAVDLNKDFLASLREHGVLVPLTAVRGDDGIVRIRNGQRRTLGAREVGLATVPVYVVPATATDESDDAVERIVHQIVTNDHKDDLTDVQRARGIQQMIEAGLSATKVAKRLSVSRDTVKAAVTAAASTTAMDALSSGQLSLTEAAAITEFEEDPAAVSKLLEAAGGPLFDHTVAQLRQDREAAKALANAAESFAVQGYRVLDERPAWRDTACVELRWLHTADGQQATEEAISDPAHWAVWLDEEVDYVDRDTGEAVDEDSIDFFTEHHAEREPEEGLRAFSTVIETAVYAPVWFCIDYLGAGLELEEFLRNARPVVHGEGQANDTDTDQDETRARREADAADVAKRERRKVLALNKLGEAAMGVRREFVRKLLARKTTPKGAAVFVAGCLARDKFLLDQHHGEEVAAELLGVDNGAGIGNLVDNLGVGGDGRAQMITLALVLGSLEARTPKDAWRSAAGAVWSHSAKPADYLTFLTANGYPLSGVEEVITGQRSSEGVYSEFCS
jgi:ParB family transcriptional regulator, chromosome partitioning protein